MSKSKLEKLEQLCKRCGLYRCYRHPKTDKVYNLCAKCGWEAIVELLELADDESWNAQTGEMNEQSAEVI